MNLLWCQIWWSYNTWFFQTAYCSLLVNTHFVTDNIIYRIFTQIQLKRGCFKDMHYSKWFWWVVNSRSSSWKIEIQCTLKYRQHRLGTDFHDWQQQCFLLMIILTYHWSHCHLMNFGSSVRPTKNNRNIKLIL